MARIMRSFPLPLLLITALFITGCRSGGEGGGRDEQQTRAEEIITSRTMGLAFLEENKLEEAAQEFSRLIELAPDEAIGYANLGLVYLRMGEYEEAEKNLQQALELNPDDPDIRLNLATVYKYQNRTDRFVQELERAISEDSTHIQSVYQLAEYYGTSADPQARELREIYLRRAVAIAPANIVPRLYLIETLIQEGNNGEALFQLEEIPRIYPDFSEEAGEYYNRTFDAIRAGRLDEARTSMLIFHNFLKLSEPYSQGVTELKGFEGAAVGSPTFTFSETTSLFIAEGESILDAIRFTDVTQSAGLAVYGGGQSPQAGNVPYPPAHIAIGDFDHNGSEDLYLGTFLEEGREYGHFMLQSDLGMFVDVKGAYGINHRGVESHASFADFDNDGWFDLLVIADGEPVLYKSVSEGNYEDVTDRAFPEKPSGITEGLFMDMDHEGDLDLYLTSESGGRLFRNNGDGTFSDYSEPSGLAGPATGSVEACFGDFDDDGDLDLVVLNGDGGCNLYANLREGRYREITSGSGLPAAGNARMIAAADYNNDGFMDLFTSGAEATTFSWYRNRGDGTFDKESGKDWAPGAYEGFSALDAAFTDFDNDGHMDLAVTGDPSGSGTRGLILLHNDGGEGFRDVSHLLPEEVEGGCQVAFADYNRDGDMDILLAGLNGGVRLLRNDGGNANHHLKIRLIGVKAGSGKNNHYGIGAKIELRAGNLYQMKVVTQPDVYFGLGDRSSVDVVRILWTNGTPQNIFNPGIEQDLIEEQQLKGSCPFLYAWNGEAYVFVKDIMWRSALGMPMGIMGEEQTYAFADASEDYHKIPGSMLKPRDGRYSIQVTDELWETLYMDEFQLLVVDHPDSLEIYVDEKFAPPPYPPLTIHQVGRKIMPVMARDGYGNDVTGLLLQKDDRYVGGFKKDRYQGITEMRSLEIDPGMLPQSEKMYLFLNGWIFPTDASINFALSQGENEKSVPPCLQVINSAGEWETVIGNIGFPQGKDKTVIVDLSGRYLTGDHRVRICTNMEIYWDQAFFSPTVSEGIQQVVRLDPVGADHHYRGFSRMYRKGGPYGPHWFDYSSVSTEPKWRDLRGNYTRFGDVLELLLQSDNKYIIANAGDETTIEFDAGSLEEPPPGWKRDFLIYSVGWVKDGDMNTAEGNRVEPLPFHGLDRYPYGGTVNYPNDRELERYQRKYNTRVVTDREFSRALVEMK